MSGGTTEILLTSKQDSHHNVCDTNLGKIAKISIKKMIKVSYTIILDII